MNLSFLKCGPGIICIHHPAEIDWKKEIIINQVCPKRNHIFFFKDISITLPVTFEGKLASIKRVLYFHF